MIAYNMSDGVPVECQESPLEKGVFNLPANSTKVKPPSYNPETHTCQFDGNEWVVEEIPQPPEPPPIDAMELLRTIRNDLISETDWTQARDIKLPNDEEWKVFRQELRDLPQTQTPSVDKNGNITNVTWPKKPS